MILFYPVGWAPEASEPVLSRYPVASIQSLPGTLEEGSYLAPLLNAIYFSVAARPALPEELQQNRFGLVEALYPKLGCPVDDTELLSILRVLSRETYFEQGRYGGGSTEPTPFDESMLLAKKDTYINLRALGAELLLTGGRRKHFSALFLFLRQPDYALGKSAAPFSGRLPRGLLPSFTRQEVRRLLGAPSLLADNWDRWDAERPLLHCDYARAGEELQQVTLMVSA